jgi:micrococcal nuclease
MKTRILFPLLTILIIGIGPTRAEENRYLVKAIEDGDTLVVEMDGQPERVQLMGIDAPENTNTPKLQRDVQRTGLGESQLLEIGNAAAAHLQSLVKPGDHIRIDDARLRRDKYGRYTVIAYAAENRSLNQAMVEDGYAVVLGRYPLPALLKAGFEEAESSARKNGHGLWGSYPETARAWGG